MRPQRVTCALLAGGRMCKFHVAEWPVPRGRGNAVRFLTTIKRVSGSGQEPRGGQGCGRDRLPSWAQLAVLSHPHWHQLAAVGFAPPLGQAGQGFQHGEGRGTGLPFARSALQRL